MAFFADLGRFPEAVILPSRPVGGVWLRDYLLCFATCTWPTTLPSFSTATACRSKEFSSSTALQSTRIRGRGGGLNCEEKAQVLVITPPPLFFLKVGRKRGGRNSGAVRYIPAWSMLFSWSRVSAFELAFQPMCHHVTILEANNNKAGK